MFLIDTPSNNADSRCHRLVPWTQDRGLEVSSATQRLDAYNAVQNTYLNTFQIFGGLGLLLGTAGLGVVVFRNVLERRAEFALFTAVGLRSRVLHKLIMMEHGALLARWSLDWHRGRARRNRAGIARTDAAGKLSWPVNHARRGLRQRIDLDVGCGAHCVAR